MENLLTLAAVGLFLTCGFTAIAAARSRRERREVERAAAFRARLNAGMPLRHPDTPGPPGLAELRKHHALYEFIAGQLADIEVQP
jgi:hypothetical protein